jgi:hypothetical protein
MGEILAGCAAVLRPGGLLVLTTPAALTLAQAINPLLSIIARQNMIGSHTGPTPMPSSLRFGESTVDGAARAASRPHRSCSYAASTAQLKATTPRR